MLGRIRGFFRRVPPSVRFDDEAVVRTRGDGGTETIRWLDLEKVSIVTTDEGPWGEDVYWVLEGRGGGCAVPQGAAGCDLLFERLAQLPGFNSQAVIEAMGSTDNAKFLCWERKPTR